MNARRFTAAAALGLVLFATIVAACSGVGDTTPEAVACGDLATFRKVSKVLEQRCGSLDCHGQFNRPLRLYGQQGLRRPEPVDSGNVPDATGYYPGGSLDTTDAELRDNYRSVCGLEPEKTAQVAGAQGKAPPAPQPDILSLVRKPRLTEKHKGGRIFQPGREGDKCLTAWISNGTFDDAACNAELSHN